MSEGINRLASTLDFLKELDQDSEQFTELSQALINNLFVLLRSAGMHDLQNEAMNRPFEAMAETVNAFIDLFNEGISLQLVDGNFFISKRIVKLDFGTFQNARYLKRIFEFLGINEMAFTSKLTRSALSLFLVAALKVIRDKQGKLYDYPLGTIQVRKMIASETEAYEADEDPRAQILSIYASGLLMLRQFVNDLRKGRAPQHSKVKRLCLELIDMAPRFHNMLLSLIHLEVYKGNLFCHMLNTAIMAIVFGLRLGMNRKQLVDLGMAAFHHDLGWALLGTLEQSTGDGDDVALTMEGINYIRNQSNTEMEEMRIKVARALVRLGGFNELVISRLIVAYECQIPEDLPSEGLYYGDIGSSFMTNVVRMASAYDELTTPRQGKDAYLPDQAMKQILDDGGETYDLFLAKLFASCIGAFPVGSMVELDTSEVGIVVNLPREPLHFHRPQVRLLIDRMGQPLKEGPVVSLDERKRGGRKYLRTIERALDSRLYGINITHFFFGDGAEAMDRVSKSFQGS